MSKRTQLELIELPPPAPRIRAGDRVSYQHNDKWYTGTIESFAPSLNGADGAWIDLGNAIDWVRLEDLRSPF
ncbi:MAG TPA: hypothetical protein V6C88_10385 [Chroococcidiopsis sp.]